MEPSEIETALDVIEKTMDEVASLFDTKHLSPAEGTTVLLGLLVLTTKRSGLPVERLVSVLTSAYERCPVAFPVPPVKGAQVSE
jgi:hypothetical protein